MEIVAGSKFKCTFATARSQDVSAEAGVDDEQRYDAIAIYLMGGCGQL
jgi:hypothetical protein